MLTKRIESSTCIIEFEALVYGDLFVKFSNGIGDTEDSLYIKVDNNGYSAVRLDDGSIHVFSGSIKCIPVEICDKDGDADILRFKVKEVYEQ